MTLKKEKGPKFIVMDNLRSSCQFDLEISISLDFWFFRKFFEKYFDNLTSTKKIKKFFPLGNWDLNSSRPVHNNNQTASSFLKTDYSRLKLLFGKREIISNSESQINNWSLLQGKVWQSEQHPQKREWCYFFSSLSSLSIWFFPNKLEL